MKTIRKIMKSIIAVSIMLMISIFMNKSYAAELAVSANGNSVTISSQYTGRVNISVSGGTASQSSVWLENSSETITISGVSSSGATVTVTPATMSDSDGNTKSVAAKSVKIAGSGNATSRDNTTNTDNNNSNTDNKKKTEEKKSEPTFKSANDTMYATGDINVRKSYSADSDKIGSLKAGEKVTRTGVGDNGWSKVSYNGGTGYIKTSLLTDKEPKKSEDKTLKSLSIEGAELNPAFDPEITDYAVTFTEGDKLDIKAEANDEKAKVEITGNESLKDGDNTIKVTVTAEDGTTRIYTIIAAKGDAKAGMLKTLKVTGYTLSPAFSSNVKEYKITILDSSVNSIDVVAESSIDKAKVEISGNTGLVEGNNTILVKVSSEDGSKTDTYKIIATKNTSNNAAGSTATKKDNKSNWILYGGIAIIALLIIAIIVVIIISRRNAYYDDDEEYDDEDVENEGDNKQDDYSDLYGYSTKSEVKTSEPSTDENSEKEKFLNESIYGDFSAKANNERAAMENQEEKPKYEDGFSYNALNSKDMYETPTENSSEYTKLPDYDNFHAPVDDVKGETSGVKDVDYYSNKVSEMFDQTGDAASNTAEEMNQNDAQADSNNYPTTDWDDDYRPRRSKGKHAK